MVAGRVVRFDGARGYGFIAPQDGGEDIFLHANDLLVPESLVHAGVTVEFEVEDGGRGLKASSVRLPQGAQVPVVPTSPFQQSVRSGDSEDTMCDVLTVAEYTREVTELLLTAGPGLTGAQIVDVRARLVQLAKNRGWAED